MAVVVAVLSMKGGVGKTTVALGLASAAWSRGLRTLVVDMDPQANASMALEAVEAPFSTSDVLADARPGVAAEAVGASGWGEQVQVIAAERSLEHRNVAAGRASAQRLRTALATLPKDFDLVVIDCPPSLGELTRNALTAADRAIVVTEPNHFAVHGAAEAFEAISVIKSTANARLEPAAVVINRMHSNDREHRMHAEEIKATYGDLVFGTALPECPAIPQSQRSAGPVHSWNSPGAQQVTDAFDDLLDKFVPPAAPRPRRHRFSLRRFLP